MKRKKLVIISHTEHYINQNQQIVGWGATINEINYLADFWEEVVHVACLYPSKAPKSALPYTKSTIRLEAISPYGGKSILDKIKIVFKIPKIIYTVIKSQKNATEVQLRLPTSMGLFLLPLFRFFLSKKYTFWVKYAGNWNQAKPPLSYRVQRWWLKKNIAKCKVTINGFWNNQPKHCISFENPCLTEEQLKEGKFIAKNKTYNAPFTFVFVGRLEDAKGVSRIIEAFKHIPIEKIEAIHFIGDGVNLEKYKKETFFLGDKVIFHGFLNKEKVHQVLSESHFLLLPSKSEGFPKVIAEAACYGVIPIVSNVGSIPHYINETNGFVWQIGIESYTKVLQKVILEESKSLSKKTFSLHNLAKKFTFTAYLKKLNSSIFNT